MEYQSKLWQIEIEFASWNVILKYAYQSLFIEEILQDNLIGYASFFLWRR